MPSVLQVIAGIRATHSTVSRDIRGAVVSGSDETSIEQEDTWLFERSTVASSEAPQQWRLCARIKDPPSDELLAQKPPDEMQNLSRTLWETQKASLKNTWFGMFLDIVDTQPPSPPNGTLVKQSAEDTAVNRTVEGKPPNQQHTQVKPKKKRKDVNT